MIPNLATLYYGYKNNLAKLLIPTPSLNNYQIMCLTTSMKHWKCSCLSPKNVLVHTLVTIFICLTIHHVNGALFSFLLH